MASRIFPASHSRRGYSARIGRSAYAVAERRSRLEASHWPAASPHVAFAPQLRGSFREKRLRCSRTTTLFGGVAWVAASFHVAFAPRLRSSYREKRILCSRTTKSFGGVGLASRIFPRRIRAAATELVS
jgi:hypothetical protein